jgi:hypothetical protein
LELDLETGFKLDLVLEPESKPGPSFRIETRIETGIFEKNRNLGKKWSGTRPLTNR